MLGFSTLIQMRLFISRHLGGSITDLKETRIDEGINHEYAEAINRHRWRQLTRGVESGFTTVGGQSHIFLPKEVETLFFFADPDSLRFPAQEVVENFFEERDALRGTVGLIDAFTEIGEYGIKSEFNSTAETVSITPGAGQSGTVKYLILGKLGDDEVFEDLTTSGEVATASARLYDDILQINTNGANTEPVKIAGITSGIEYATIGATERTVRYKKVRLDKATTSADTIAIYYRKRVPMLLDNKQSPEIPISDYLQERVIAGQYSQNRKWQAAAQTHIAASERIWDGLMIKEKVHSDVMDRSIPKMRSLAGRRR